MIRKSTILPAVLVTGAFLGMGCAQPPPPPPDTTAPPPSAGTPPAATSTRRGTIKSFNTGPNGETNVILRDGTTVMVPPEFGAQLRSIAKQGSRITVSGVSRPGASGQVIIDAQTVTSNGQTMTVPAPPPPDPNAPPPPLGRRKGPRRAPPPPPPANAPPNGAPPPPAGPPPPAPPRRF
ncbi:MAG: OB-fold nucleic acid binding domain-containing protein [Bryobacteraceae bacterium]